jgi:dienelactone hydrolase
VADNKQLFLLAVLLGTPVQAADLVKVGGALFSPTEVTQADYESVTGSSPSFYKGLRRPVENVSWWDAIRYCNLRSTKEGLTPCYDLATGRCDRSRNGYRLPTSEEWDLAAASSDPRQANLSSGGTKDTAPLLDLIRAGTRDVASFAPNKSGLFDMLGNVWEWTGEDEPAVACVIRGGSFLSSKTGWNRGYRSSLEPDRKSRFTGFRVVRTAVDDWFEPYNRRPPGYETSTGNLTPLTDIAGLKEKWTGILGSMSIKPPAPSARPAAAIRNPGYRGELMYLRTEPDSEEKILILRPDHPVRTPTPVVIVPYYDVDVPAGQDLYGRHFEPSRVRAYARLAVERGYIAAAIRWFGESYGERYDEAVANLKMRHPNVTGLGKWVWDAQRLLDYLYTLPEVDRNHIGIIGHSLGAKMALYAAAMDPRISAVVFSEGGIGFHMSNYDDFWYLGDAIHHLPKGADQHELLALIAPRPFLLIGGDEYDKAESWHYVNAARAVYQRLGKPENIGYFNHHTGHTPTPEAVSLAMRWLDHFLR